MPRRADADTPVLDADDLDGGLDGGLGAGPGPGPRSSRLPFERVRSRWAVPVATAVVVLLVGAAAVHQARAAAAEGSARAEVLAGVQLSTPSVGFDSSPSERDTEGRLLAQVQVQAFNAGSEPVELTALATSLTSAELLPTEEPVGLDPGAGRLLVLPLAVDCDALPPPGQVVTVDPGTGVPVETGATTWVRLAVDAGGERTERRYLVPGQTWAGGLTEQLASACAPNAHGQEISTDAVVDAEGRLRVSVANASGGPARLVLLAPPSLRASTDVPLPADVPAGSSLQLVVTLDPACELASPDPGDRPLQADVALETEQGTAQSLSDTTVTTAWVARQVALACG